MTHRYIAYDYMNVPRVYGDGPTADIAQTRCAEELLEYRKRRPDLARQGFEIKAERPVTT